MKDRRIKIAALCSLLVVSGTLLIAAVMSGGLFQMFKTLIGSGGGSSKVAGGPFTLAHNVGQSNAKTMTGGAFELSSGYNGQPAAAGAGPQAGNVTIPSAVVVGGLFLGVPLNAAFSISFDDAMDPASLQAASSLTAQRDKDGYSIQSPVAITVSYDAPSNTVTLTPNALLDNNNLYLLRISTDARSASGVALAAALTRQFETLFDNAQSNVFADLSGTTRLIVPPQAIPAPGYFVIKTDPEQDPYRIDPAIIREANGKIVSDYGAFRTPIVVREINIFDASGALIEISPSKAASLVMEYQDNGQGVLQADRPPVRVSTLSMWMLDENRKLWVKLPGSLLDAQARTVAAPVTHVSVFALIGDADTDVSQVFAYPTPWKPKAGNSSRYGTLADGITFTSLPSLGTLRIYTLSGELVASIEHANGLPTEKWMGTNSLGSPVASGVYLWEIRSGSNRKTGKLMVVW